MIRYFIFFFLMTALFAEEGYVTVKLRGQFGNQLFQIATAYAYALDHDLILTVPDLVYNKNDNIPINASKLFLSRIYHQDRFVAQIWEEPSFNYTKIPATRNFELQGHFQSEKYFQHRREEILELFAPPKGMEDQIFAKYPFLKSSDLVVGIQIRDYRKEFPRGDHHPTVGRDYYRKAMSLFPKNTLFLVASNNPKYAKDCLHGLSSSIIYLRDSGNYMEQFYTLSLCKSFIISNSTFGWWAAWLAKSPNKVVIAPCPWFSYPYDNQVMTRDIFPDEWIVLPYKIVNKQR